MTPAVSHEGIVSPEHLREGAHHATGDFRVRPDEEKVRILQAVSVLLAVMIGPSPLVGQTQSSDWSGFRAEAIATLQKDTAAMEGFSFRRRVVRRTLGRDGEPKSVETLDSRVTPTSSGFDERLLEIDGRRPTAREVEQHREAGTFSRHHRQLLEGSVDFGLAADLRLSVLLETYRYEFVGEESLNGVPCYRFEVQPFDAPEDATRMERIAAASHGSFWITREGRHFARMEVQLANPLRMVGVTLRALDLSMEKQEHHGEWLTTRAEVRSEFRFGVTVRKHNTWTYWDFVPEGG